MVVLFACCVFVAPVKFLWCGEIKKRRGRENFFGCMCGLRAKGHER